MKKPPSQKQTKTITSTSVSRKIPTYGAPRPKFTSARTHSPLTFLPRAICIQASGGAAPRPKFTKMGEAHLRQ